MVKSKLVKQEVNHTVILPPMLIVLWFGLKELLSSQPHERLVPAPGKKKFSTTICTPCDANTHPSNMISVNPLDCVVPTTLTGDTFNPCKLMHYCVNSQNGFGQYNVQWNLDLTKKTETFHELIWPIATWLQQEQEQQLPDDVLCQKQELKEIEHTHCCCCGGGHHHWPLRPRAKFVTDNLTPSVVQVVF